MTMVTIRKDHGLSLVAGLLVATLLLATLPAAAQGKAGSAGLFKVRYLPEPYEPFEQFLLRAKRLGSPQVTEEVKMKAQLGKEVLAFEGKDRKKQRVVFSIPVEALTSVSSRYQRRVPLHEYYTAAYQADQARDRDFSEDREDRSVEALGLPIAIGLATLIHLGRDYNVTLAWQEEGQERSAVFRVKTRNYDAFMTELEKATGRPWLNLHRQWKKFEQAPKSKEGWKIIPVRLERHARVGQTQLPAGFYDAVLIERSATEGELYLFEADMVHHEGFVAVAPVEFASVATSAGAPTEMPERIRGSQVSFQELEGISGFSEIRTPEKVIKFTGGKAEGIRP